MIDRVHITNFRRISHADIEIRDGITVLTGANGTGKSTVIEAVAFNLYGKVKSGTKKETIRRHGASDDEPTTTAVDFHLGGPDGTTLHYRCVRYLTKKLSVMASLRSYDDDEWPKVSAQGDPTDVDKGIGTEVATGTTGVTAAVAELLGVSYEGFSASFVARQKELDSLASSLTPEARKKFFLDLLGYSRLDDIRPEISKEVRARNDTVKALGRQAMSPTEIGRRIEEEEKALSVVSERIAKGDEMVRGREAELDALRTRHTELTTLMEKVSAARRAIERDDADLSRRRQAIDRLRADAEENERKADGYDADSGIARQLMEARDRVRAAHEYENTARERDRMAGAMDELRGLIEAGERDITALRERTSEEPDVDSAQQTLSEARRGEAVAESRLAQARGQLASIGELIESVDRGETAKCPTCGSDVSTAKGREHLAAERETLETEIGGIEGDLAARRGEVSAAQEELARRKQLLRTYNADVSRMRSLERECELRRRTLEDNERAIAKSDEWLAAHADARRTSAEIEAMEMGAAELARKAEREEEMKRAFMAMRSARERLAAEEARASELEASVAEARATIEANGGIDDELRDLTARRDECERTARAWRGRLEELRRDQGSGEARVRSLGEQLERAKAQEEDMARLTRELEAYVGAKAVVDRLRERLPAKIAPALSLRASRLLDRATNGMYTMLDIDESYEVSVYTEHGVSPVSLMSGGEQDIISLCIRIAIAEMILETTGVGEQTMIFDEIFGALDDERRATACAALAGIGDMIPRIVCVTHIEEIKDLADHTYVVERDEEGVSTVREVTGEGGLLMPRVGSPKEGLTGASEGARLGAA